MKKYLFYLLIVSLVSIAKPVLCQAQTIENKVLTGTATFEGNIGSLLFYYDSNNDLVRVSLVSTNLPKLIPVNSKSDTCCLQISILTHNGQLWELRKYSPKDLAERFDTDTLDIGQVYDIYEYIDPNILPDDDFESIIRVEYWLAYPKQPDKIYHLWGEIIKPKKRNNLK